MNTKKVLIDEAIEKIHALGYQTSLECTNSDKPDQIQQLFVHKNGKVIAKVSLMLACRVNTMQNGVGRNELPLFKILCNLSAQM